MWQEASAPGAFEEAEHLLRHSEENPGDVLAAVVRSVSANGADVRADA